jgi:hypothetical protein
MYQLHIVEAGEDAHTVAITEENISDKVAVEESFMQDRCRGDEWCMACWGALCSFDEAYSHGDR